MQLHDHTYFAPEKDPAEKLTHGTPDVIVSSGGDVGDLLVQVPKPPSKECHLEPLSYRINQTETLSHLRFSN